ncbi:MAG: glycerophosphodiester phosphodiesterase [Anaerolineae bacterium]|nr:glycerophosphodiester phosphodiesterase [Anaerolineae bacterium]
MPSSLPLDAFYLGRTLNFGHRGASHDAPQNTLAAFELAAQYGADGVELDVYLTRDGHLVVIHDEAVDKTTDGTGPISAMTLADVKALDAGSRFDAAFAGQRIPTLDEVFEAVGARLLVNVELKGLSWRQDGLEAAAAQTVARHGMTGRVLISSFNPLRLRRMRRIAPDLPLGLLEMPGPAHWARWLLTGVRYEAHHPYHVVVTRRYMAWARSHNLRVNTWTVNDPDRMADLRDLGVDLIMTDRPDMLRDVLHGAR